jgi:hypothetical protein
MLNLRQFNASDKSAMTISTVNFAWPTEINHDRPAPEVIGNIGENIDYDDDWEEGDGNVDEVSQGCVRCRLWSLIRLQDSTAPGSRNILGRHEAIQEVSASWAQTCVHCPALTN